MRVTEFAKLVSPVSHDDQQNFGKYCKGLAQD